MINESYKSMLGAKSVIRELSEYATARGKEIGYENVFDFSLGNPSVAVPQEFTDEMIRLLKEEDTMTLHGYTPSLGNPLYKEKIRLRSYGIAKSDSPVYMEIKKKSEGIVYKRRFELL